MGTNQDYSQYKDRNSQSEGCVIIMIIFTVFAGFASIEPYAAQFFPLTIALGLSTIAIAILHLAKVLQNRDK